MRIRFSQHGMSMLSLMVMLLIISFVVTCSVKLVPLYIDSWQVKKCIDNVVVKQRERTESFTEIRKAIDRQFTANRIEAIAVKDIKITKNKGKLLINANYEKRVALFYNIDVVVKFDNLAYEIEPSTEDD